MNHQSYVLLLSATSSVQQVISVKDEDGNIRAWLIPRLMNSTSLIFCSTSTCDYHKCISSLPWFPWWLPTTDQQLNGMQDHPHFWILPTRPQINGSSRQLIRSPPLQWGRPEIPLHTHAKDIRIHELVIDLQTRPKWPSYVSAWILYFSAFFSRRPLNSTQKWAILHQEKPLRWSILISDGVWTLQSTNIVTV